MSNKPPKTPQKVTFNSQNNNNNSINLPNPANIEKDKWLTLESNEIYVIRNESINKTNEWIYYKLQREKYLNKRVKNKNSLFLKKLMEINRRTHLLKEQKMKE